MAATLRTGRLEHRVPGFWHFDASGQSFGRCLAGFRGGRVSGLRRVSGLISERLGGGACEFGSGKFSVRWSRIRCDGSGLRTLGAAQTGSLLRPWSTSPSFYFEIGCTPVTGEATSRRQKETHGVSKLLDRRSRRVTSSPRRERSTRDRHKSWTRRRTSRRSLQPEHRGK